MLIVYLRSKRGSSLQVYQSIGQVFSSVGVVYILLTPQNFSYSCVIPQRMMAVSQRYDWREISQFSMPIDYYVNFLGLQKKHVRLQMTIHKRSSFLTLTPDQRACIKKLEQVIVDSKTTHQLVTLESPAGTG